MSSRRDYGSGTPSNASARQNEYFIPRDGIDREVITADICRYLGNDALVRPGTYEDKKTGRVIQGYFVTAYRNLTSAMIADLKADSARWDQERRNHSGARYSDSQNRFSGAGLSQYDTSGAIYPAGPSRDSYESVPRYPGSDAPGYSASTGSQPYQQDSRQSGYGVQYPQTATYPPQQDSRFQVPAQTSAFPDYPNSHPTSLGAPDSRTYVRGGNMTTQPPQQRMVPQPYPDGRMETESHFSSYPNQTPGYYTAGLSSYPPQQPEDVLSGRHAYGSTGQFDRQLDRQYEPQPQYENQTPPPSRPVASSSSQAQTGHSGTSHSRRGDRERDRDDRPRRR